MTARMTLMASFASVLLGACVLILLIVVGLDHDESSTESSQLEDDVAEITDRIKELHLLVQSTIAPAQEEVAVERVEVHERPPGEGVEEEASTDALVKVEAEEVQGLKLAIRQLELQVSGLAAALTAKMIYGDLDWNRLLDHRPPPLAQTEILALPVGMPYAEVVRRCGLPLKLNGNILDRGSASFRAIENDGSHGRTTVDFAGGLVRGR